MNALEKNIVARGEALAALQVVLAVVSSRE
jgi:hypothetical protein